jgi:hypothetical protein
MNLGIIWVSQIRFKPLNNFEGLLGIPLLVKTLTRSYIDYGI